MSEEKKTPPGPEYFWEDPVSFTRGFQQAVFKALNDMGREIGRHGSPEAWPFSTSAPRAQVVEEDEEIRVIVDLPGVMEDDLEITLERDRLIVRGERKPPEGTPEEKSSGYGKFRKSIDIRGEIEPDKIDAVLQNGVLTVTLPKKQAKKVKVKIKKT